MDTAAKLGLPPGYRFVPTDEELVGDYLLPRILEQALPANDIREVDPLSAPPSVLVDDRRRKGDSFFFAAGQPMNARGGRQKRTCVGGGTWEGQGKQKTKRAEDADAGKNTKLMRAVPAVQPGMPPVLEEIGWEKRAFNFHEDTDRGSTGWVMHEYTITAPPRAAASLMRVYRVRFSGHGKIAQQKRKRDAQAQQQHCVDDGDGDGDGEIVQADGEDDGAPPVTRTRYDAAMEEFEYAAAASTFVAAAPAADQYTFAPQHQDQAIVGAAYYPPPPAPQTEATTVYYSTEEEYATAAGMFVGEDGRYYYTFAPQHEPVAGDDAAPVPPLVEYPPCAADQTQPDTATMFLGEDGRYYYYTPFAPPPQQQPDQPPTTISCFPAVDAAFNGGDDLAADRTEVPPAVVDDALDGNNLAGPTTVAAAAEEDVADGNPAADDGTTVVDDAGAGSAVPPSPRPWDEADEDELDRLLAATSPSHDELFCELFSDTNVVDESGHSA